MIRQSMICKRQANIWIVVILGGAYSSTPQTQGSQDNSSYSTSTDNAQGAILNYPLNYLLNQQHSFLYKGSGLGYGRPKPVLDGTGEKKSGGNFFRFWQKFTIQNLRKTLMLLHAWNMVVMIVILDYFATFCTW